MTFHNFDDKHSMARVSIFSSEKGTEEIYLSISSVSGGPFQEQWKFVSETHARVCSKIGLNSSTEVAHEVYISDSYNQKQYLLDTDFFQQRLQDGESVIAISQLPPLVLVNNGKIWMKSYHIKGKQPVKKTALSYANKKNIGLCVSHGAYEQFWFVNLSDSQLEEQASSYEQTQNIFTALQKQVLQNKMSLLNNAIRTWIYVRDIDNNYAGMVNARREIFSTAGLKSSTRYIASTGIEGCQNDPWCLVSMNALLYQNIDSSQIVRMEAPGNMKSPYDYGVTFERGTELLFGDRKHMYISGTASIDQEGRTMHLGDIVQQTHRTMENIKALLDHSQAGVSDIAYLVIYLRDGADRAAVKDIVFQSIDKNTPVIFLRSSVCRPDWLVEIEGVAIAPYTNENFSDF